MSDTSCVVRYEFVLPDDRCLTLVPSCEFVLRAKGVSMKAGRLSRGGVVVRVDGAFVGGERCSCLYRVLCWMRWRLEFAPVAQFRQGPL